MRWRRCRTWASSRSTGTRSAPILEKRILDEVGRRLIPDIHERIVTKFSYAPNDFAQDLNAHLGSAFSLEPMLTQSAYFRVHNRDDAYPEPVFRRRGHASGRGHSRRGGQRQGDGGADAGADHDARRKVKRARRVYCGLRRHRARAIPRRV